MIRDLDPIHQALIASLFTWGVTALGAAVVFVLPPQSKKLLDVSLGFAAGVMTAASFWSLLAPAIELAEAKLESFAFLPIAVGFGVGAAFVHLADRLMPQCVLSEFSIADMLADERAMFVRESSRDTKLKIDEKVEEIADPTNIQWTERYGTVNDISSGTSLRKRVTSSRTDKPESSNSGCDEHSEPATTTVSFVEPSSRATERERALVAAISWRRIVLLIMAVTVHNIPEGLAVGVTFASVGKTASSTFESAFNLALGIGLQNFPEGLAVSLPLAAFGHSKLKSFFYGQLSGMVEPIAALLGAAAVLKMEFILPYALSFAAGAMIYVVVDDIIPEAQRNGNGKLASIGAILGFIIMMSLDVGLG